MLAAQRSLHPVLSCCLCTSSGNLSAQVCVPVPVYSVSRLYVVFTTNFHYVPTRSAYVPTRSAVAFETICWNFIRSYTFWATLTQFQKNMYSDHTFLYVLCNPPTNPEKNVLKSYVPIRSEQPSRSSCLISYVPKRSGYVPTRSTNEFEKKLRFPYVPKRSVQQYRKSLLEKKN